MNQRERMEAELPFLPGKDGLFELRMRCQELLFEYNALSPAAVEQRNRLIRQILGKAGEKVWIESPFHCDYGCHIEVGERFYANFNLVILDVGKVIIGDDVLLAPNVAIYSVGHPLDAEMRRAGYEFGKTVRIGNNVWIGGNTVLNPGVSIGENTVVGSGSVVTRDIPAGVLAFGNPARVARAITGEDRQFYYKKCRFDFESLPPVRPT